MNTIAGKFTTKGMILDICSMRSHALRLLDNKKSYSDILQCLLKVDYYYNDNFTLPNLKTIEKETGIKYSKIRKQIELIYSELSTADFTEKSAFEFKDLEVVFHIRGFKGSTSIICKNLPKIPQIDEQISLPFFKELTGTNLFHVARVQHEFMDDKQQINVILEHGDSNLYWKIRKDLAIETKEIGFHDLFHKSDYELKKMLNIRRGHAW